LRCGFYLGYPTALSVNQPKHDYFELKSASANKDMMFSPAIYFISLAYLSAFAGLGWLLTLKPRNVTLVDSFWALFFLLACLVNAIFLPQLSPRAWLILTLVSLWSIRLSGYLHWRNHGKPEDARYQAIRARNEPHFEYKSLYLVFLLQAILAWMISLPLQAAMQSTSSTTIWLDGLGLVFWLIGMGFQVIGDLQLASFKSNPSNHGKVLDKGVWRYTRHPNYFGESCIWWGYFCIAWAAGAWWSVVSPIFMTFLLVKVTGVKLLEAEIATRRPAYADYIKRTSAFIPLKPKLGSSK
jgi:steroid 5-alpha reductase family enzyme